jgi:hypothetical protein
VADPTAGRSVDVPDWSTPETPAGTPPSSGYPHPVSWPAHSTRQPGPPRQGPGPGAVPEFERPTDRRWWFLLGIVAALLSCCCVAAGLITLARSSDLYGGQRGPNRHDGPGAPTGGGVTSSPFVGPPPVDGT